MLCTGKLPLVNGKLRVQTCVPKISLIENLSYICILDLHRSTKYPNDVYMTCTWYILTYRAIYHPQLGQLVSWLPQIANISKNTGNLPCFWGKNLHLVTYHVFFSSEAHKAKVHFAVSRFILQFWVLGND